MSTINTKILILHVSLAAYDIVDYSEIGTHDGPAHADEADASLRVGMKGKFMHIFR